MGTTRTFLSRPRKHRLAQSGRFLGWWILAICGIAVFASSSGLTYTVSVYVDPVIEDLGISRSLLSTAYALGTGIGGLVLLWMGKPLERWGNRKVMAVGAIGLAAGLVVLSLATGPWLLFLGFPMIRTFGQGTMPLAARVLIPNWFYRHRARAFSLLGLSSVAAIALLPLANSWLIDQFGWRMAWRIMAVALVIVIVPMVLRFVRDRPEDVGQYPDGARVDADGVAPVTDAGVGFTLAEAKRTPAFWALVLAGSVQPLIMTGQHLHQSAIFVDRGAPESIAAATFTLEAASMLAANLGMGWFGNRLSPRLTLGVCLIMMCVTLLALLFSGYAAVAVLYGVLRGGTSGAMMIAIDVAWPTYYGRKHLGSIRGFGMAAALFGSAIGPLPFGIAADYFGGYVPAIIGLMLLPLSVGIFVFATRPPKLPVPDEGPVRTPGGQQSPA